MPYYSRITSIISITSQTIQIWNKVYRSVAAVLTMTDQNRPAASIMELYVVSLPMPVPLSPITKANFQPGIALSQFSRPSFHGCPANATMINLMYGCSKARLPKPYVRLGEIQTAATSEDPPYFPPCRSGGKPDQLGHAPEFPLQDAPTINRDR